MLLCLLFAAIEVVVAAAGQSRTLAAQLMGIAGLTLPSAAVLAIGGVSIDTVTQFWLIWFLGRLATTASVRTAIASNKTSTTVTSSSLCDLLLITTTVACGWGMLVVYPTWLVTIPLLLSAVVLRIMVPHPRHLKRIGWSLLVVNLFSGVLNVWVWNF